jgi:hypothetical protein
MIIYIIIQGGFLVCGPGPWLCVSRDSWCTACSEVHMNFANESASLMADNVWNEVVTIHRSQEVLKILSSVHVDIFRN